MLFVTLLSTILIGTLFKSALALPIHLGQTPEPHVHNTLPDPIQAQGFFSWFTQPEKAPRAHQSLPWASIDTILERRSSMIRLQNGYGAEFRKRSNPDKDILPSKIQPVYRFDSTFNSTKKHDPRSRRVQRLPRANVDEFDLDYTLEVPTTSHSVSHDPVLEDSAPETTIDPDMPPTSEIPPTITFVPMDSSDSEIATPIPDDLGFPKTGSSPNYSFTRVLYGTGILHYKCKLPIDGGTTGLWTYSSTEAGLYHDSGYTVRIGQVSCNSTSPGTCAWSIENNGGLITAKMVKSIPAPNALDADWMRSDALRSESSTQAGTLGDVRTVFTVATIGGKPPHMMPCNENNAGEKIMVDFNAEYQFYSSS